MAVRSWPGSGQPTTFSAVPTPPCSPPIRMDRQKWCGADLQQKPVGLPNTISGEGNRDFHALRGKPKWGSITIAEALPYPTCYHDLAPAWSSQPHFSVIYRFLWRKEKYKDGNSDLPPVSPSRDTLCLRSCGQEAVQVPSVQFGGEAAALKGGGSTEKWEKKVSTGNGHEQDHPRCSTELAAVLVPVGHQVGEWILGRIAGFFSPGSLLHAPGHWLRARMREEEKEK